MKKTTYLTAFIFIGICLLGCKIANSSDTEVKSKNPVVDSADRMPQKVESINYCYRNEIPWKDEPETIDVTELSIEINGNSVKGIYNWLPAYKDQMYGTFEGILEGSIIKATYIFEQEGNTDTSAITINLKDDEAILDGESIKKVDCDKYNIIVE